MTALSVSDVLSPDRSSASRKWTWPSSMCSRVGRELRPVTMSASQPVFFSSVATKLDERESPINPVSGDFAKTANLLEVVSLVPTSGLHTKMRGFAGLRGSTLGGQCL